MDDLTLAITAARAGGVVVLDHFGRPAAADLKGRNNPVTAADHASEAAILEILRRERPADAILAEESGGGGDGRRWLVDPLDGTVNFVHGIPQVSVSIALYDGGQPLVGVVLDVIHGELFAAEAGGGATLDGRPLHVSSTDGLATAVVGTGFPYDHHEHAEEYTKTVAGMLHHVNGIRRFGSAALDLAWVAAGRFDAYWEYFLAPWDVAAGTLLVREAGGVVTNAAGDTLVPEDNVIVAANDALHASILEIIQNTLPAHVRASPTAP